MSSVHPPKGQLEEMHRLEVCKRGNGHEAKGKEKLLLLSVLLLTAVSSGFGKF